MGILGNIFGQSEDGTGNDWGMRLALMGQVLAAADQGQVANIAPGIAALSERRRRIADQVKTQKWMANQAALLADKNPRMAQMLQDAPPEIGQSLIAQYYQTLPEFRAPDWKTFESQGDVYRYNPLDPNSKPELFFDAPDDPFKRLLNSVIPTAPGSAERPAPSAPPAGSAASASPSGAMPPAAPDASTSSAASLPPQMRVIAQSFGLPENATPADVMSVAQAGIVGGADLARSTADAISKRYSEAQTNQFNATKEQTANAFKLQDDYWRVGQNYQKIIDTAQEISTLPDDPNGFERLMTLYKFMRTLDPQGAVRESDAGLAQNASGPLSRLDQLIEKYSGVSGGDIPQDAAQEMKRLILQLGEITSQADYKARKKTLTRAKAMGIPDAQAEDMIFGGLQDQVDMSGYTPRFQPPERAPETPTNPAEPGAPAQPRPEDYQELDPAVMTEGVEYPGDDGKSYTKRNGKVWVNDGSGWKEFVR